jgi:GNAT superfamily N-acetyltransferase
MRRTKRKLRAAAEKKSVRFTIRKAVRRDLPDVVRMSSGVEEIENYPGQKMKAADFVHFVAGDGALMLVAIGSRGPAGREEVVGFITVYKSENYFYLPYAVTKKGWRRHGIAGALLDAVEQLAKEEKVEYILMSVYYYNSKVHTFLRARGYVPSKKLVQYSKIIPKKGRK